jgi:hypothetical protein
MVAVLAALGQGAVHCLDDVAAHPEIAQAPLGVEANHPSNGIDFVISGFGGQKNNL